jgi:hypothetical protein
MQIWVNEQPNWCAIRMAVFSYAFRALRNIHPPFMLILEVQLQLLKHLT